MTSADFSQEVLSLVKLASPENASEVELLWQTYKPVISTLSTDMPGFHLEALGAHILVRPRTLPLFYLYSHAFWGAVQAYSGPLWLCDLLRLPLDTQSLADTPGQAEADQTFLRTLSDADRLLNITDGGEFHWPVEVPLSANITTLSPQNRAVFELYALAVAFSMLHELQHVISSKNKKEHRGEKKTQQEHRCDAYARSFLLDRVPEYVAASKYDKARVIDKRAMGIAVALFLNARVTLPEAKAGSRTHPPVTDRLARLVKDVNLRGSENALLSLAANALCELIVAGAIPFKLEFSDLGDLCRRLILLLAQAYQSAPSRSTKNLTRKRG